MRRFIPAAGTTLFIAAASFVIIRDYLPNMTTAGKIYSALSLTIMAAIIYAFLKWYKKNYPK